MNVNVVKIRDNDRASTPVPVEIEDEHARASFMKKPLAQQAHIIAMCAYANEKATRERVDALAEMTTRSLWGRLRWLLSGQ